MQGCAYGGVRGLLRLEGLVLFIASTVGYFALSDHPWWLFLALFLVPDLALLVYMADRRTGVIAYNALHTKIGPIVFLALMYATSHLVWGALAAIWLAHIGMDRMVGYGLRYTDETEMTHLGPVGALKQAQTSH